MPVTILYLLKLSISLSIVWLFYQLLLRRLTFYSWNRWYLIAYSLLAFVIPLVHISPMAQDHTEGENMIMVYVPALMEPVAHPSKQEAPTISYWNIVLLLFLLGGLCMLVRLLIQWISLRRIRKGAKLILNSKVAIYQVDKPIIPFSFGRCIYVSDQRQYTEKEWEEIILHEFIHVRQRHTIDILLGELLVIVNWYNPFSWLIRFSIRQNLEFIADQQVLANGFDKQGYQYHLLRVTGQAQYKLANNFNFSSLKKRIIMMNKSKSARLNFIRFIFIMPILAVLLLAFRDRIALSNASSQTPIVAVTRDLDTVPMIRDTAIGDSREGRIVVKDVIVEKGGTTAGQQQANVIIDTVYATGATPGQANEKIDTVYLQNRDQGASVPAPGNEGQLGVMLAVDNEHNPEQARKVKTSLDDKAASGSGWTGYPMGDVNHPNYQIDGADASLEAIRNLPIENILAIRVVKYDSIRHIPYVKPGYDGTVNVITKGHAGMIKHIALDTMPIRVVQGHPLKRNVMVVDSVVVGHPSKSDAAMIEKVVVGHPMKSGMPMTERVVVGHPMKSGVPMTERVVVGHPMRVAVRVVDTVRLPLTPLESFIHVQNRPLVLINGKEASGRQVHDLPIESVASFTILDVKDASKLYGEKGMNGAVLIETKKE